MTHEHTCYIPANVTTWTVHGLWPTEKTSQGPQFCNASSHTLDFDPASLNPILGQLIKFWPNLYNDTELYNFWKHEWCKHGTCAITLDSINSELKYFQKGLELQKKFDLLRILSDAGIKPSDEATYEFTEFLNGLMKGLGARPTISCVYVKDTKTQYIAQIEFCISKDFDVIDCPTKHGGPLFFAPRATILRQPDRHAYVATKSKQTKDGGPQSCEQHFDLTRSRVSYESLCRDTETLAFPVIKHFLGGQ